MNLLKIIPIAESLPERYFSYFSKENINIGDLVEIKIKNRKVLGIIFEINDIKNEKINLKTENFILKKIEKVIAKNFIQKDLLNTISDYYYLSGVKESFIFNNLITKSFLEEVKINTDKIKLQKIKKEEDNKKEKIKISPLGERVEFYKKEIDKSFKRNESLVIFSPTINELDYLKNKILEKINIKEEQIITIHSGLTEKNQMENFKKIINKESKEYCIFSTSNLTPFILKEDINLKKIILEKENSSNYFTINYKKQILNYSDLIKKITKALNLELIIASNILSLNEIEKHKSEIKIITEKYQERNKESRPIKIIDMNKEKENTERDENLKKYNKTYFSLELAKKIEKCKIENEGKIFIYTKRKGLFTETVCADCNTILTCESCNNPMILFSKKNNDERIYVCSKCKRNIKINKEENLICKNCSSWRMTTLGIATEGIANNLKEIGFKTFILDKENVKTEIKAKKIITEFQKEKLAIIVGTEMALNYIANSQINLTAVISIDSLFSIPEFNIDEKIITIFANLSEKISSPIYIETRLLENKIWDYIKNEKYLNFLEEELNNRKVLSLPPFVKILKFELIGKEIKNKEKLEKLILSILKEEKIDNGESKISWYKDKNKTDIFGIMFLEKEYLEDKNDSPTILSKKLIPLLENFNLKINPEKIF